mmetsp:Transcript_16959/g.54267  ORF Transcript_16959/g.54267 Transcript_16959/m.54267 type:complete len:327 (-) Transcript_16959:1612-2592(-)
MARQDAGGGLPADRGVLQRRSGSACSVWAGRPGGGMVLQDKGGGSGAGRHLIQHSDKGLCRAWPARGCRGVVWQDGSCASRAVDGGVQVPRQGIRPREAARKGRRRLPQNVAGRLRRRGRGSVRRHDLRGGLCRPAPRQPRGVARPHGALRRPARPQALRQCRGRPRQGRPPRRGGRVAEANGGDARGRVLLLRGQGGAPGAPCGEGPGQRDQRLRAGRPGRRRRGPACAGGGRGRGGRLRGLRRPHQRLCQGGEGRGGCGVARQAGGERPAARRGGLCQPHRRVCAGWKARGGRCLLPQDRGRRLAALCFCIQLRNECPCPGGTA